MTDNDLITIGWMAGLFEGEGSIGLSGNSRVIVAIQMTDLDVLERVQANFGGKIYSTKKQKEHHKDCWKWTITKTETAKDFLRAILPYMGKRRSERIRYALDHLKDNRSVKKTLLIEEVVRMRELGLSHQAIADEMKYERSYISHILRKNK